MIFITHHEYLYSYVTIWLNLKEFEPTINEVYPYFETEGVRDGLIVEQCVRDRRGP
jgi:hypothetical protein